MGVLRVFFLHRWCETSGRSLTTTGGAASPWCRPTATPPTPSSRGRTTRGSSYPVTKSRDKRFLELGQKVGLWLRESRIKLAQPRTHIIAHHVSCLTTFIRAFCFAGQPLGPVASCGCALHRPYCRQPARSDHGGRRQVVSSHLSMDVNGK